MGIYTEHIDHDLISDEKIVYRTRDVWTEAFLRLTNIISNAGLTPFVHKILTTVTNSQAQLSTGELMTIVMAGAIHGHNTYEVHEKSELDMKQPDNIKRLIWISLKLSNFLMQATLLEIAQTTSATNIIEGLAVLGTTPFPDNFFGNVGTVILMINRIGGLIGFGAFVAPTVIKAGIQTAKITMKTIEVIGVSIDKFAQALEKLNEKKLARVRVKK